MTKVIELDKQNYSDKNLTTTVTLHMSVTPKNK